MIVLLILAALAVQIEGSHLRGGIASWRVHENYPNGTAMIKSSVWYNIRTSSCPYSSFHPYRQTTRTGATDLEQSISLDHSCGDECPEETWTTTQLVQYVLQDSTDASIMSVTSSAWIGGLSGFTESDITSYSLPYLADLRVTNSAPIAIIQPTVKFMSGCASTITIPTMDEDGDSVTCRFAQDQLEGGAIINMNYPHLTLLSVKP